MTVIERLPAWAAARTERMAHGPVTRVYRVAENGLWKHGAARRDVTASPPLQRCSGSNRGPRHHRRRRPRNRMRTRGARSAHYVEAALPGERANQVGTCRETLDAQPELRDVALERPTSRATARRDLKIVRGSVRRAASRARNTNCLPGTPGRRVRNTRSGTGSCAPRRTRCPATASDTSSPAPLLASPTSPSLVRAGKLCPAPVRSSAPGQIAPIRRA